MCETFDDEEVEAAAKRSEGYRQHDAGTLYLTMALVAVVGAWSFVEAALNWAGPEGPSDGLLTTLAQVDVGVLIAFAVDGGRSRWTRRGAGCAAASLGLAILGLIQKYDVAALAAIALLFASVAFLIALVLRHYGRR